MLGYGRGYRTKPQRRGVGTLKDYRAVPDNKTRKELTLRPLYIRILLNLTTKGLTMIETITTTIDAGSLVFGVFGYVWAGMACFAGVLFVSVSR